MEPGSSQQAISSLEQKEAIDKDMLEKVAKVLKVPVEAIQNYSDILMKEPLTQISQAICYMRELTMTGCTTIFVC